MNPKNIVQPSLTVLTQEQIAQVHAYSLQILATTGIRIDSERGLELLARAAGPGMVHGDRVRIPAELVEWALEKAPSSVDIHNRDGSLAFSLPGEARFGIGVTTLNYQDPETDAVTPFARQHMQSMVRLGDSLASYEAISTIGIVQDVPPEVADLYATLDMVANTTKPLVILVSEENLFPAVLDLLEHLHGDLADRPFVSPSFNDSRQRTRPALYLFQLWHGGRFDAYHTRRFLDRVERRTAGRPGPEPVDKGGQSRHPGQPASLFRHEGYGQLLRLA